MFASDKSRQNCYRRFHDKIYNSCPWGERKRSETKWENTFRFLVPYDWMENVYLVPAIRFGGLQRGAGFSIDRTERVKVKYLRRPADRNSKFQNFALLFLHLKFGVEDKLTPSLL